MKRTLLTVLFISAGLLLAPIISRNTQASELENAWTGLKEDFDPSLTSQLTSVDDLLAYVQSNCKADPRSLEYINFLDSTIRKRFYHSYSYYTVENNWVAALSGTLIWQHLSAVVDPNDIMKYPYAACSQQSMVFMECCKKLGLDYRKIGFDHHYALEIKIDGRWYFFDTNMEVTSVNRNSFEYLSSTNSLYPHYQNKFTRKEFEFVLGHPNYGPVNEDAAYKAYIFHKMTGFISQILFWGLLLVELVMLHYYLVNRNKESLLAKA